MDILHGWNAHFQDDILTVREDDGISILRWMFVSLIFNSVVESSLAQFDYIHWEVSIHRYSTCE